MAPTIAVGDEAPNFDLTSTEDVVLMLCDEVPRTALVLYFFADPADAAARDGLSELARAQPALYELSVAILGISPAKLDELKAVQRELALPFPLLHDDRGFSAHYGVVAAEGSPPPALVAVNRRQRIVWMANPAGTLGDALGEVSRALRALPSPTANLPRRSTNWLVDWWVNRAGGLRKKRA